MILKPQQALCENVTYCDNYFRVDMWRGEKKNG